MYLLVGLPVNPSRSINTNQRIQNPMRPSCALYLVCDSDLHLGNLGLSPQTRHFARTSACMITSFVAFPHSLHHLRMAPFRPDVRMP